RQLNLVCTACCYLTEAPLTRSFAVDRSAPHNPPRNPPSACEYPQLFTRPPGALAPLPPPPPHTCPSLPPLPRAPPPAPLATCALPINQNKIIKIVSVASVALLPPTLIASIYGMNFQAMPELNWRFGYPFAIALMIFSVITPFWVFRRKGWLS